MTVDNYYYKCFTTRMCATFYNSFISNLTILQTIQALRLSDYETDSGVWGSVHEKGYLWGRIWVRHCPQGPIGRTCATAPRRSPFAKLLVISSSSSSTANTVFKYGYFPSVGVRCIVINPFVCLCVGVCMSVCPRAYLWNCWTDPHEILCTDPLWPWLVPPMVALCYVMSFRFYG